MVGLTGGIGAGKTAVASRLNELGALVVDADRLAREVVEPGTDGLNEVVNLFGPTVLTPEGRLDRAAVAKLVFDDADARARLEQVIHPRVGARMAEIISAAPPRAIVVNDVPLLVEAGRAGSYDLVIVVLAREEIRVARLTGERGMTVAEARARIATQATDDERRAVADIVIVNEGTRAQLRDAVDAAWRNTILPAARTRD